MRRPVDVEPAGVRRGGAVLQHLHRTWLPVLRRRHGHVVGHDVDDEPRPCCAQRLDHPVERLRHRRLVVEHRVVDDVVAVRRPGAGLQDRRQVDVRDAEPGQVRRQRRDVVEAEAGPQLQPVGRGRGASWRQARRRSSTAERPSTLIDFPAVTRRWLADLRLGFSAVSNSHDPALAALARAAR